MNRLVPRPKWANISPNITLPHVNVAGIKNLDVIYRDFDNQG